MEWTDILTGLGFMFIFEGILPFLSPQRFHNLLAIVEQMTHRQIRVISLVSMIGGAALISVAQGLEWS